ncbi:MAG: FAD-binding oxidoreductase, partial [Bacteroidota bacterium]
MKDQLISELTILLGPEKVLTGLAVSERHTHIWRMNESLQAKAVLLPDSTEDVSAIMTICHKYQQPVVVHGGLTNLVGSAKTHKDEVVISTERMNTIEELDEQSRSITVQAGVILENLHQACSEKGLLFPMNFGAKGTAQIGGIISTNAGGLRVFRYGMTRQLVLGLEVVMADGTVISALKKIIKDNSGYDLKQLFIGSEGTLGIVTRAVLKLIEAPKSRTSAFVAFNEFTKVVGFLKFMDKGMAGLLTGYELIWESAYKVMTSPPASTKPPLPLGYKYYVLLEGLGSSQEKDQEHFQELLEEALEQELILDAVIAQSETDLNWFWTIREDVHVFAAHIKHDQHFDISLPVGEIGDFVEKVTQQLLQLEGVEVVFSFGHIADGNIHLVVGRITSEKTLIEKINQTVYEPLTEVYGSISAEHGIGTDKKPYLHLSRT